MKLLKQWENEIKNYSEKKVNEYFTNYYELEKEAYIEILKSKKTNISGKLSDLAKEYSFTDTEMAAFISGIAESIEPTIDAYELTEDSNIDFNIVWEDLYRNMHKAGANWLYSLPQWEEILTIEDRDRIVSEYRKSLQAINENKIGRNDPCSCGSGKKYKKCCGKF